MRGSAVIVVNRPIEEVWQFISDVQNMARWVSGVSEPRRTSAGELGVGSTFTSKFTYRNRTFDVRYAVTEFTPPVRFATNWTDGPFPYNGVVDLERAEGGTRVTNTVDVGSDSKATSVIFALFGPLVRAAMTRRLLTELRRLKMEIEGG